MLRTVLHRWRCLKTGGRVRSFTTSIPCAKVSTRHQRYEQSSTLEGLVNEASQASTGSSDNYRSLSKLICTVGPSTHSPSHIQNLVDIGMSVMRINCSKSTIEETKERVEWLRACQGLQGGDIQPTPTLLEFILWTFLCNKKYLLFQNSLCQINIVSSSFYHI